MRFARLLALVIAAAAAAVIMVPKASALAFDDNSCPFIKDTLIKLCPEAEQGKAYSYQIKGRLGTGCVPYVKFKAIGDLPPGLTLASDGTISGTPTQSGEWTFWVAMQDIPHEQGGISWCSDVKSTEEQFRVIVNAGLTIVQTQSTLALGQVNAPYSMQFTSSGGGTVTWSVSSGSLPAGLSLNSSTGLLSGTPTAAGDYSFKVTVSDGTRSDTQTYAMSVVVPLAIGAAPSTAGEVGVPFSANLTASGGRQPYTWSATGLPAGLSIDPATGAITGTATTPPAGPVSVTVKDSLGLTATASVNVNVAAKLAIAKHPLRPAKVGSRYSVRLATAGGVGPLAWLRLTGKLPAGIKLNARTGQLSGTAAKAGTYRFRLQVKDALGIKTSAAFVLKVTAGKSSHK
jgi:hypothetical protein